MIKECSNPSCTIKFNTERSARLYCSRSCSNQDRQRRFLKDANEFVIISSGGGVQSAAMVAMVISGKMPKPDMVVMVDTGYEKTSTLDYTNNILIPECNKINLPFNIIKTKDNRVIDESGLVRIPAFKLLQDGNIHKLNTYCNSGWKVATIKRYIKSLGIRKAVSLIGISTDESKRQRKSHSDWIVNRYPLIEYSMSRYQCLFLIRSLGWPDPVKSSCFICPLQHDNDWEYMKEKYPHDYKRAVDIDNEIEAHNKDIYLHKSMTRLRDIVWQCDVASRYGGAG